MYRKVLITAVTAAAIVGAGGSALALTGSQAAAKPSGTATVTTASTAKAHNAHKAHGAGHGLLRRLAHGQFVTKGKDGAFVTHDLIRGTVTAVSSSSISVQAADKTAETFSVGSATKVRVRQDKKGTASSIGKVAIGDQVAVAGTGTANFVAKRIVDIK